MTNTFTNMGAYLVYLYVFLPVFDVFFPPGQDYPARFSSNALSTVEPSWHPQAKLGALSNFWTVIGT